MKTRLQVLVFAIACLTASSVTAQDFSVYADGPATAAEDGWLHVYRETLDEVDGRQAFIVQYRGPEGGRVNGALVFRGALVDEVQHDAAMLDEGDEAWGTLLETPENDPRRGLEDVIEFGGPTEEDPRDTVQYTRGGRSVRFFFSADGEVDSLRIVVQYPGNPGTATMTVETYGPWQQDEDGWPSTEELMGIRVGAADGDVVDDGDYPGLYSARNIRLAVEDLDVETTLVALRVDPGGNARHHVIFLNNDADEEDFDRDNGRDQNGNARVGTTVGLTSLRYVLGSLVSVDRDIVPSSAIALRGLERGRLQVGERIPTVFSITPPEGLAEGFYQGEIIFYEDNNGNGNFEPGETFDWVAVELSVRPPDPDPDTGPDSDDPDAGDAELDGGPDDTEDTGEDDGGVVLDLGGILPDLPIDIRFPDADDDVAPDSPDDPDAGDSDPDVDPDGGDPDGGDPDADASPDTPGDTDPDSDPDGGDVPSDSDPDVTDPDVGPDVIDPDGGDVLPDTPDPDAGTDPDQGLELDAPNTPDVPGPDATIRPDFGIGLPDFGQPDAGGPDGGDPDGGDPDSGDPDGGDPDGGDPDGGDPDGGDPDGGDPDGGDPDGGDPDGGNPDGGDPDGGDPDGGDPDGGDPDGGDPDGGDPDGGDPDGGDPDGGEPDGGDPDGGVDADSPDGGADADAEPDDADGDEAPSGPNGPRGQLQGGEPCLASVSGSPSPSGLGFLFLGLLLLGLMMRRKSRPRAAVVASTTVLCLVVVIPAEAVDFDRADGSASAYRVGTVETPVRLIPGETALRLDLGFADDLLIRVDDGEVVEKVIDSRTVLRAGVMYGVAQWLAIDLVVPFSVHQSGSGLNSEYGPDNVGLLDLRADAIFTVWNPEGTRTGVAVQLWGTLPTGAEEGLLGAGGPTAGATLVGGYDFGFVTALLNLGYAHDLGEPLENLEPTGAVRAGAAVQVPWRELLLGSAELTMETPATSPFSHRETTAMEASLGGRIHLESGYYASTTGATTLSGGFGVPAWRADLALGWAPRPAVAAGILADDPVNGDLDSDGDGVPNVADKCPGEPEDPDGFEDLDGCPDTDNDGDGIPDDQDGAPFAAEDLDGFDDADGVPDPDNDLDGVPDSEDAAPELPEDWDGVEDEDGVPER